MMNIPSGPSPPGAAHPDTAHPSIGGGPGQTVNPVNPAPPSTAATPMGSIPQVGTRPAMPTDTVAGSLSSYTVVPTGDPTADASF